ncbi:MAG: hypothetical protein AAFR71_04565 [Pseudomonadota bacterium]
MIAEATGALSTDYTAFLIASITAIAVTIAIAKPAAYIGVDEPAAGAAHVVGQGDNHGRPEQQCNSSNKPEPNWYANDTIGKNIKHLICIPLPDTANFKRELLNLPVEVS